MVCTEYVTFWILIVYLSKYLSTYPKSKIIENFPGANPGVKFIPSMYLDVVCIVFVLFFIWI